MLGAYPDFSNICLKYQPRYQKLYPTDITRNDIWGARYYPSWYLTHHDIDTLMSKNYARYQRCWYPAQILNQRSNIKVSS